MNISLFNRTTNEPDQHRGTLTLLPAGDFIIGFPNGTPLSTQRAVTDYASAWAGAGKWYDQPHTPRFLALPFPVDVVDLRK